MGISKVQLSPEELDLLKNSEWILTKNRVVEKLVLGLGDIAAWMQQAFTFNFDTGSPKITRGERYEGLPYLVLDYPRLFGKEDICAIRTFLWWGRLASVTLHVKGKFLQDVLLRLSARSVEFGECRVALRGDEWVHDLTSTTYVNMENAEFIDAKFLKIGVIVKLDQWERMEEKMKAAIVQLTSLI